MNLFFEDLKIYRNQINYWILFRTFRAHPGYRYITLHRLCNTTSKWTPWGMLFRYWHKRLQWKYGIQIPLKTRIGKGLRIAHFGGIVVTGISTIGDYCHIGQGVTIGQLVRGKKAGAPTIGNKVWISANAVLVGKITIGNNVMIAPLSFIDFDVPDNAVVVGNPATIISYNGSHEYISIGLNHNL